MEVVVVLQSVDVSRVVCKRTKERRHVHPRGDVGIVVHARGVIEEEGHVFPAVELARMVGGSEE